MHAKLKKDQDLQNLLKESELLKPAISKGTTIGGKPITILEPTAEIDMNILVPKVKPHTSPFNSACVVYFIV